MAKLIFGCGYLGSRVAALWRAAGGEVFVVTRSDERAQRFAGQGLRPIVADVMDPQTLGELPAADAVLYSVGYDRTSGVSIRDVYVTGLQRVLDALPAETERFVYASSTGVYGQSQGEIVDEDSPSEPRREGGRACLAAEQLLSSHPQGRQSVILRFAGLYGPGRIPQADAIRQGEPVGAPPESTLNLIHVDDAAQVVVAAATRAPAPRTYVVSDGHPVRRRDYYGELARLLGAPPPRFVAPQAGAAVSSRATSDKRLCNDRLIAELGMTLRYASYREGLAAILAAENSSPADG